MVFILPLIGAGDFISGDGPEQAAQVRSTARAFL
jgi:hypothetical protein